VPDYAYASNDDVMTHLSASVLNLDDDIDFEKEGHEAATYIRSYLFGTHISNSVIDTWLTPDDTPALIRAIAGKMIAAKIYERETSSNAEEVDPYAVRLFNQAMATLSAIIDGRLVITELVDAGVSVTGTTHITDGNFYPNDLAPLGDQIKFKMGVDY